MLKLHKAITLDLPFMVSFSDIKRLDYEKAQPQFWRHAPEAEETQLRWFEKLLAKDDHLILVARQNDQVTGFIIGRLLITPEVYNPGGLTLMIDDFCISEQHNWESTGGALIGELRQSAKEKGAAQVLVVCGAHDEAKRKFLKDSRLQVASEWYVDKITA